MIIVTVVNEPFKRYVVDRSDEYMFDGFNPKESRFVFGAQALRRNGIDEQYRCLDSDCVVKVSRK